MPTKPDPTALICTAEVYHQGAGNFRSYQCGRRAVTTSGGTPTCGMHSPDAIKRRADRSAERWNAKLAQEKAAAKRRSMAQQALAREPAASACVEALRNALSFGRRCEPGCKCGYDKWEATARAALAAWDAEAR